MDNKDIDAFIWFGIGCGVGAVIFMSLAWPMRDKAKHYDTVVEACEAFQPRHVQCDVFAAPVQEVFVQATQTNVLPQQGDRS